jgi:hypothetical protein
MEQDERKVWTPAEVARQFGVDTRTVGRWCRTRIIPEDAVFWTPGGHRRFRPDKMRELMSTMPSRGRWANTNRTETSELGAGL